MITRRRVLGTVVVNELAWLLLGIVGWRSLSSVALAGSWAAVALVILLPAVGAFFLGRWMGRRSC